MVNESGSSRVGKVMLFCLLLFYFLLAQLGEAAWYPHVACLYITAQPGLMWPFWEEALTGVFWTTQPGLIWPVSLAGALLSLMVCSVMMKKAGWMALKGNGIMIFMGESQMMGLVRVQDERGFSIVARISL